MRSGMQQQAPSHTAVSELRRDAGWCCSGPSSDYEHDVLLIDIGSAGFGWDERFFGSKYVKS